MITPHKVRMSGTSSRILSKTEELAIRLCHHDHGGESIEDTAVYMDMTFAQVKKVLRRTEKKAPQLFPILFPIHREVLELCSVSPRLTRAEVRARTGMSQGKLGRMVTVLRKHGVLINRKPDQYRPHMDKYIREKF